jgi:hypothetical protein
VDSNWQQQVRHQQQGHQQQQEPIQQKARQQVRDTNNGRDISSSREDGKRKMPTAEKAWTTIGSRSKISFSNSCRNISNSRLDNKSRDANKSRNLDSPPLIKNQIINSRDYEDLRESESLPYKNSDFCGIAKMHFRKHPSCD